jgi:hypothetical protein
MADRKKPLNSYGEVIAQTIRLGQLQAQASTTETRIFYGMDELTGFRGNLRKARILIQTRWQR